MMTIKKLLIIICALTNINIYFTWSADNYRMQVELSLRVAPLSVRFLQPLESLSNKMDQKTLYFVCVK